MITLIKKKLADFFLEVLIIVIGAVGSVLWVMNAAQAANEQRVISLEKQIEVLRLENRQDHQHIIEMLRNK